MANRKRKDKNWHQYLAERQRVEGECIVWTRSLDVNGYGQAFFRGKVTKAHRLSWIINVGEIPDGLGVLHTCDNPKCVNPRHLYLGDQKQNISDVYKRGRSNHAKGEKHPSAKISEGDVLAIRKAWVDGTQQIRLAKVYGLDDSTINNIIRRKTWKHVA